MLMETSPSEIVGIASGEGQIPVSFTSGPNWEALAFPSLQEETTLTRKVIIIDLLLILNTYFMQ